MPILKPGEVKDGRETRRVSKATAGRLKAIINTKRLKGIIFRSAFGSYVVDVEAPVAFWKKVDAGNQLTAILHLSQPDGEDVPLCETWDTDNPRHRFVKHGEAANCAECLRIASESDSQGFRIITRTEVMDVLRVATIGGISFPGCNVMQIGFVSKNSVDFELEIESVLEAESFQSMQFRIRNARQ